MRWPRRLQPVELDPALNVRGREWWRLAFEAGAYKRSARRREILARTSWALRPIGRSGRVTRGDVAIAVTPLVFWAVVHMLFFVLGFGGRWGAMLAGPLVLGSYIVWIMWAMRRWMSGRWWLVLREEGHPVCIKCGHLMTAMAPEATCPECGFDHEGVPVGGKAETAAESAERAGGGE